ncbi:MAG: hypothetical protein L6W00_13810 [Lentisphaeria bacterium]|nr:MAG: hypothetical protein L6W00_13810 [Lentisphaeria bacterium]
MSEKMKIAVDAMGGDYAPGVVVEGLAIALTDFPEYDFVLVGHAEKLVFYLEKYGIAGHPRVTVVHAPSVCEMSEPSAISLRAKRDSSITVCARLLKEKKVDAMVTPGHTGATVAATKVLVRTLPGDRPARAGGQPPRPRGAFHSDGRRCQSGLHTGQPGAVCRDGGDLCAVSFFIWSVPVSACSVSAERISRGVN